jgi:anti-anti-sigma factor
MPLTIRVTHEDGKQLGQVRVALDGSLDTATAPDLEKALQPLYAANLRVLVLDLAGLRFLSSAGIRVLMTARKELSARGGSFAMTNLQPQIAKVIEIVKALPGVSVFRNDAEMDEYLTAMQKKVVEGEQPD